MPNSLAIRRFDQRRRWSARMVSILAILSSFAISLPLPPGLRRRINGELLSLKLAYFEAPPGGRFWALADNQLFARITGGTSGTAAWYLTDWQGSVRNITDASGNLQDTITYDGFGNVTS